MINEQIRDREVRVIGEEGQQLGVMPPKEAMKLAKEANEMCIRDSYGGTGKYAGSI